MGANSRNVAASAVIGACLIDPETVDAVAGVLGPEDFPTAAGREVFAAMLALRGRGRPTDFVLVCAELERRGTLDDVGEDRLMEAMNRCPSSLHALDYAGVLADRGGG